MSKNDRKDQKYIVGQIKVESVPFCQFSLFLNSNKEKIKLLKSNRI